MKIKEAAAMYGISTQALYQRIAKTGKKTKDLTNGANGDLTEEGESLLASWFCKQTEEPCTHCKELQAKIDLLESDIKSLQAALQAANLDKDRLYSLLAAAQQTAQALTVARITAENKAGILQRVKDFFTGTKAN